MYFDGSLAPRRVISLSGASKFGQSRTSRGQPVGFLSAKKERERAGHTILQFLRRIIQLKRELLPLRDILPELLAKAELWCQSLPPSSSASSSNQIIEASIKEKLVCHKESKEEGSENGTENTNVSKTENRTSFEVYSNAVTRHPICKFIRVLVALANIDWKSDYSHYFRRALYLFKTWYFTAEKGTGIDELIKEPLLKAQLLYLCVKFFRVLIPRRDLSSVASQRKRAKRGQNPSIIDDPNLAQNTCRVGLTEDKSSSSSTPTSIFSSYNAGLPSKKLLAVGSDRRLPVHVNPDEPDTVKASINTLIEHLYLNRKPLSFDEGLVVYYAAALFRFIPQTVAQDLNREYHLATEWLPIMLRRVIAGDVHDENVVYALLYLAQQLRESCTTKEMAFKQLINVWSVAELNLGNKVDLMAHIAEVTLSSEFIQGICCVGCKLRESHEYSGTTTNNEVSAEKADAVMTTLKRTAKSLVPLTVSLNNEVWQIVESRLRSQVNALLGAQSFMTFLSVIHNYTEDVEIDTIEQKTKAPVDYEERSINYVRYGGFYNFVFGEEDLMRGTITSSRESVYKLIFNNMLSLLIALKSIEFTKSDKVWIASALALVLFCSQFYSLEERRSMWFSKSDRLDILFKILRSYRGDEYIVLNVLLILSPVIKWQYFSADPDAAVVENATAVVHRITSAEEVVDTLPKLRGLIAIEFVSSKVPLLLLNIFRRHHSNCCTASFSQFVACLSAGQSNDSTMCCLWRIFAMLLDYCLHAMDDATLVGDEDEPGLFGPDEALFIVNALNYTFLYHVQPQSKIEKWDTFQVNDQFPWNKFCSCGIEVSVNDLFHVSKGNLGFTSLYWGQLAHRFSRRFFRHPDKTHRPDVIDDVERSVIRHINTNHLGSPIINALRYIPQAVSFDTRLQLFMAYIRNDKLIYRNEMPDDFDLPPCLIRRSHILEDGLGTLGRLNGIQLKQHFRVVFVDETGRREEGIDGGGLFKEFLTQLCHVIFNPGYGIFEESPYDRSFAPSPNSALVHDDHLSVFNFVGKVVAKALYEHILVEHVLSRLLLNFMLKQRNGLDDFKHFDPELYRNLVSIRNMSAEDIESLGLTFTTSVSSFGDSVQAEIVDGGSNKKVTKENCDYFIFQFADFKCNRLIESQSVAFLRGFSELIPLDWLQMFSPSELVHLISGSVSVINVNDMCQNATYSGGYSAESTVIVWFWEIMHEFDEEQRRTFLWFVTCCKRAPLLGFKQLNPPFCITRDQNDRNLPTVSTCTNLLKLPEYSSKEELRSKLVDAMTMSKGFGIS
ncbi:E3 ubiquitin-protein ligase UPL6 [Babesia sp. Xinjiang]|uniref:E3 ubiquitin-protein ligase UPL6 n=1 Tax=Babesia sp. Xinjiang TaxID=462227 RepID=UPI000A236A73|nr:E3 ubiquitin-protein ligase UPL6 [Babesia sp. Xinjiang]XP_028872045.1 E3 ubiquitin-protein ligase UPL6 [Babesia sp. Xinjiang]ORM41541.1 E3 ubiquitin-protein ligase UPL6 [Babesia sp. Xinjiang]ORM41589.1 E3 ubiquitin-protein ligase UPL6 [Babesia sp. Xinjiang]